jgi:hypothetical protein
MGEDMLDIYEARTGLSREKLITMMAEETWLNAREAKNLGFVDEIEDADAVIELRAVAQLDKYKHTPAAVRAAIKSPGTGPAAKGSKMDDDEEQELRAKLRALEEENAKLKAKAEGDDESESDGAGDDEPHSKDDDDEESDDDRAAARAAEIGALVARGYIAPGEKAGALKMSAMAFARYSDRLLKLGPIVPVARIKPPVGKTPTVNAEKDHDAEPSPAEKAYMKASGKSLDQVRALGALPASQVTQVVYDYGTRKAAN